MSACRSSDRDACNGVHAATGVDCPVRDPSVLVLVHSFTGRTATAGREIADLLGGAFLRASDPPHVSDVTPLPASELKDVLPRVRMDGVRHLYLGFPIYNGMPSPIAYELVRNLTLNGVRVTPFFTYLHYVDPVALDALSIEIAARGGAPTEPIAFLLPALVSDEDILRRTRRAVLQRRELWEEGPAQPPEVRCDAAPPPHAVRLCAVPSGIVWTGQVSKEESDIVSNPPRLVRVGAFHMDEKEITIAQYRRCVATQRCRERRPRGVSAALQIHEDLPMPDLSWSDVAAYCAFVGLRLPTEAEWTRAARGSSLAPYPWGDALPGSGSPRANLGEKPKDGIDQYALAPPESEWSGDGVAGLSPGCRFPLGSGPYGHCDLIGNLLEWIDAPTPMAKGGSWIDVEPAYASIAARTLSDQRSMGSYLTGGRCARDD